MGVLVIACGFIGGVLVEKGQSSSSSSAGGASGLASRFAALRAGASGASRPGASGTGTPALAGAVGAGGFGGGAAGARPVASTPDGRHRCLRRRRHAVCDQLRRQHRQGHDLGGTTVNKTVKSDVKGIHPGETVTVTGETGSGGSISAESIRVGSGGGGLAALFGGPARAAAQAQLTQRGGEPALFGGWPCKTRAVRRLDHATKSRFPTSTEDCSSTKELHASHQHPQPQARGRRGCNPVAGLSGPGGLRRLVSTRTSTSANAASTGASTRFHGTSSTGIHRLPRRARHRARTRLGPLRGDARMPAEERHHAPQAHPGSRPGGGFSRAPVRAADRSCPRA